MSKQDELWKLCEEFNSLLRKAWEKLDTIEDWVDENTNSDIFELENSQGHRCIGCDWYELNSYDEKEIRDWYDEVKI